MNIRILSYYIVGQNQDSDNDVKPIKCRVMTNKWTILWGLLADGIYWDSMFDPKTISPSSSVYDNHQPGYRLAMGSVDEQSCRTLMAGSEEPVQPLECRTQPCIWHAYGFVGSCHRLIKRGSNSQTAWPINKRNGLEIHLPWQYFDISVQT